MERIGVVPFWKSYDRKAVLRTAQLADDLGYDSIWIPEAWAYEQFQLLTEIALPTKRLKLATGIANVFSRSAGLLAMSAATLDEISEGRAILGLGTSGKVVVENFHGVPYEKPLTRLRETDRHLRALWRGDRLQPGAEHALRRAPLQARDDAAALRHPDLRRVAAGQGDPRGRRASPTAGCRRSGRTGTSRTASRCSTRARAPRAAIRRRIEVAPFMAIVPLDDVAMARAMIKPLVVVLHRRHGRLLPRALLPLRLRGERRPGARPLQHRRPQAGRRPR